MTAERHLLAALRGRLPASAEGLLAANARIIEAVGLAADAGQVPEAAGRRLPKAAPAGGARRRGRRMTGLALRTALALAVALAALISLGLAQPPRVLVQFAESAR